MNKESLELIKKVQESTPTRKYSNSLNSEKAKGLI